jgi:type I restriction enzyme S subunit
MSGWRTVPLGEALTFQRGFDITKDEQREGPYSVISSSGPKSTHTEYKVRGPGVIIGRKGSLGTVFYSEDHYWPHDTTLWIKEFHGNDPRFAYYFLQTMGFERLDAGASNPSLNRNHIHTIPVWLPPLPIQRRIAGILSAYDELIENSQRRIKILESMARALYREWFVHFRFPAHESVPRVPSPLGEIPQGWEVKKLVSLMSGHIGGGWGKEVPDEDHTEPAWVIRGTDIPDARSSQVANVPHRFHTPSNLRSRRLAIGDILFEVSGGSKGQPVGRTLLITPQLMSAFDGEVICASFCKRIRPDADSYGTELLYLSFLEGYESGEIEQFQVQSTGISNFKWTEYIAQTVRAVPPSPLRSSFREKVVPLFAEVATLGLQIQNLRRTRDLLLPRLLSGQIDVEALDHV